MSKDAIMADNPFSDEHEDIMQEFLQHRITVGRRIAKRITGSAVNGDAFKPDTEDVMNMNSVFDGIEKNIERQSKLKIARQKNKIDLEVGSGNNLAGALREILQEEAELNRKAQQQEYVEPEYQPKNLDIKDGELVDGEDNETLAEFNARTGNE